MGVQELKKIFNIPVFPDSINARNREKIITHLRVFLRIQKPKMSTYLKHVEIIKF